MANGKSKKPLLRMFAVLIALAMLFSSAGAATRKISYTVKVENDVLVLYQNGVKLDPTYPMQSTREIRLSTENGKLAVSYTDSGGKLRKLRMGDAATDEFKIQGKLFVLTLDESLGGATVTIDKKANVEYLNVNHNGTLIHNGTIGECTVNGTASLRLKSNSRINSLRIANNGATVTAEKKAVVLKAVKIRNGATPNLPIKTATPTAPVPTPTPTANSASNAPNTPVNMVYLDTHLSANKMAIGYVLQLTAAAYPESATNRTIVWSVSNGTGAATIDQSGWITPVRLGTVTVTATNPNSGVFDSKTILIVEEPAIIAQRFEVVNTLGFKGYVVTFTILNATQDEVKLAEVSLWNNETKIASSCTFSIHTKDPNSSTISVGLGVSGSFEGGWTSGIQRELKTAIPNRAEISIHFAQNINPKTAQITDLIGDPSVILQEP